MRTVGPRPRPCHCPLSRASRIKSFHDLCLKAPCGPGGDWGRGKGSTVRGSCRPEAGRLSGRPGPGPSLALARCSGRLSRPASSHGVSSARPRVPSYVDRSDGTEPPACLQWPCLPPEVRVAGHCWGPCAPCGV